MQAARQVLGYTSPNPAVGAVVMKDGLEVGRGATQPPGQAHAEIGALRQAGDRARGGELYVTLEPCCHWGRTPPCTGAITQAGIRRVSAAAIDPNPLVGGQGLAELEAAGIEVVLEAPVEGVTELYESFFKHVTTGLPFVTAKYAMSLDGKIATRTGDSKWVTGPPARSLVQQMRRQADAILVGVSTVLADDPLLTSRDDNGLPLERQPLRAVLDSACRIPPSARMLSQPGVTVVYTRDDAPPARVRALDQAGAQVVAMPGDSGGRVALGEVLADLGAREIVDLIVEGGGQVLGSCFDQGLVDKVYAFVAPVIIGGAAAASPVAGDGSATMAGAWRIENARTQPVGDDSLIVGYPRRSG